MLTRNGVAKRLRRSIATVRRLEGRVLFPMLDDLGVHRFREEEVDGIAAQLAAGRSVAAARGDWLQEWKEPGRLKRKAQRTKPAKSTAVSTERLGRPLRQLAANLL